MKSIMEEASSIIKAIEKAWQRADKPQNFSVKVFEEPEKNFLGITTKSAKIGLFFDEDKKWDKKPVTAWQKPKKPIAPVQPKKPFAEKKLIKKKPAPTTISAPDRPITGIKKPSLWNDQMVSIATKWVTDLLDLMGIKNISFTTSVKGNYLKLYFDSPVVEDQHKERFLFSSFAHLIIATLQNHFKKDLSHLKIILTHSQNYDTQP